MLEKTKFAREISFFRRILGLAPKLNTVRERKESSAFEAGAVTTCTFEC
jgi:hypothetical protein